jgi:hypothetical protein
MAVPCGMPVSLKIASVCRSNTHYLSIFHIVSPDLSASECFNKFCAVDRRIQYKLLQR